MNYKAILFDLDGTLLPMEQELFTRKYFNELAKKLVPYGIEEQKLISSVWAGTKAMVMNSGRHRNEEVFWEVFLAASGLDGEVVKPVTELFYTHEFNNVRKCSIPNPLAAEVVKRAHFHERKVVLATNPLFPLCGQLTRLSWIGLSERDFDLVTSYESDSFCKPNPMYYISICERIDIKPEECLMIGNDETEDMHSASSVGMDCILVTDTAIYSEKHPWTGRKMSFNKLTEVL